MLKRIAALLLALCALGMTVSALAEAEPAAEIWMEPETETGWPRDGLFISDDGRFLTLFFGENETGESVWTVGLMALTEILSGEARVEEDALIAELLDMDGKPVRTVVLTETADGQVQMAAENGETVLFHVMDLTQAMADMDYSEFAREETVEPQEVFNDHGVRVTVTGFGNVMYYPVLKMELENHSGRELTFDLNHVTLNGWMWEASLCQWDDSPSYNEVTDLTVADGETVACGLGFTNELYYPLCGIEAFEEIGCVLRGCEPEDWENTAILIPVQVRTSAAPEEDAPREARGTVLYEADGIRIASDGVYDGEFQGPGVIIVVDNRTERYIRVTLADSSLNGEPVECSLYAEVAPGRRCLQIMSPFGAEQAVERVSSMGASFRIEAYDPILFETETLVESTDFVTVSFAE